MRRKTIAFLVQSEYDDWTLRDFLKRCSVSSRMITKLKKEDIGIVRNGKRIRTIDTVHEDDIIELLIPTDKNDISPVEGKLDILYEDEFVLILNKPPFMPVHPVKIHQNDTLANIVSYHMRKKGENYAFRALNRLDMNTSGIVVTAKDRYSSFVLSNGIDKTYHALCEGEIRGKGSVDKNIRVMDDHTIQRIVSDDGQRAVTNYESIWTNGKISLLEIKLETGRTHQIRCHMSYIGHPLCGDDMYGGHTDYICRQALHCSRAVLAHPVTKETVDIRCSLPDDMKNVLRLFSADESELDYCKDR